MIFSANTGEPPSGIQIQDPLAPLSNAALSRLCEAHSESGSFQLSKPRSRNPDEGFGSKMRSVYTKCDRHFLQGAALPDARLCPSFSSDCPIKSLVLSSMLLDSKCPPTWVEYSGRRLSQSYSFPFMRNISPFSRFILIIGFRLSTTFSQLDHWPLPSIQVRVRELHMVRGPTIDERQLSLIVSVHWSCVYSTRLLGCNPYLEIYSIESYKTCGVLSRVLISTGDAHSNENRIGLWRLWAPLGQLYAHLIMWSLVPYGYQDIEAHIILAGRRKL